MKKIEKNEDGEYSGDGVLIVDLEEINKVLTPVKAGDLIKKNVKMDLSCEEWDQESSNSTFDGGGFYIAGGDILYKDEPFINFQETGCDDATMNASCEIVNQDLFVEFVFDFIRDENDGVLPAPEEDSSRKICEKLQDGVNGAAWSIEEYGDTVEYEIRVEQGSFAVVTKGNKIIKTSCDILDYTEPGVTWFLMALFGGYEQGGEGEPQEEIEVDMETAEEMENCLGSGFAYGD